MKQVSKPAKQRLITLSRLLSQQTGEKITSVELASLTGWTSDTIRRDISLLELHSGVSNGYEVKVLKNAIEKFLGFPDMQNKISICIVGLGTLGQGLLESAIFEEYGFELKAGFDTNQNRLDLINSTIPLFPTLDLETKIRQLKIQYSLLSVSDEKAQFMAYRLVKYGIKGIINYTNTVLTLPPQIKIINASPVFMLQLLQQ